jgi:GGDEF domain-containing protein
MLRLNTKSIQFKTAIIYVFITLVNITIFDLMVFENQYDLIVQNAVLNSLHKASGLKYKIDAIVKEDDELSRVALNKIIKEANILGMQDLTLFSEGGRIFVSVKDNKLDNRDRASVQEMSMINKAITKQGFEDKLFYHDVDTRQGLIHLYVPFTFQEGKIGVAAIMWRMLDFEKQRNYLFLQIIIIAVVIVMLHLGFGIIFSKMLLFPLRKLNEATNSIARGDLEIRVPIVRDDEIGQLASSFNEMSVALQRMRDEAKGANPLTGLPGNITIATYIDSALHARRTFCVMYCDLDNFKAYNDKYGFTKGDEGILYTKDCLLAAASRKDMQNIFVGHEGGDDFVVICDYPYWENFAKAFITTFDRGIYQFYNSVDARNGFIESINRQGQRQRFPLMSVSIAVVSNKERPFTRHAEMIQVAAEIKKYVKSIDGSCYAIDRRTGPVGSTGGDGMAPPPQQAAQYAQPPQPLQRPPQGGAPQSGGFPGPHGR